MKAVPVRELENHPSASLREVARGEVVLVTDRGRVVAELRRPTGDVLLTGLDQVQARLHEEGVLVPGLPQAPAASRRTRTRLDGDTARLLDAERAER